VLNEIDWSKIKFHKKGLNSQKPESHKPGDVVYHSIFHYLKLGKLILSEEGSKVASWECDVVNSKDLDSGLVKKGEQVIVSPKDMMMQITV
jgi:hypothetical protein